MDPIPVQEDNQNQATYSEVRVLKQRGYFGVIPPVLTILEGTTPQNSANYSVSFFIADRPYEILEITERHEAAASDGSFDVRKVPSGVAVSAGTSVLTSNIQLTGAVDTNLKGTLSPTLSTRRLSPGDSLALSTSGLLTTVKGITISVLLRAI